VTTWADVLTTVIGAYEVFGTEHPELASAEVQPGAEVTFSVNVDPIGPVTVIATIPIPLAPPTDVVVVSFRDVNATEIAMPAAPAAGKKP
jgi:hypothetical protein